MPVAAVWPECLDLVAIFFQENARAGARHQVFDGALHGRSNQHRCQHARAGLGDPGLAKNHAGREQRTASSERGRLIGNLAESPEPAHHRVMPVRPEPLGNRNIRLLHSSSRGGDGRFSDIASGQ